MIRRLIAISRPIFYVPALGAFFVGLLAGEGPILAIGTLIGALFVTFPMGLIGYGINDIYDRESDEQNPRKGGVDGARLTHSEIRYLVISIVVVAALSLLCALTYRYVGLAMAMFLIYAVAYTYSATPIRLKNRPGLDSLSNGIGVIGVFMLGYWADIHGTAALQLPPLNILAVIGLFSAALHALGAAMDHDVDQAVGDTTICVAFGKTKTLLLCSLAYFVCLPLVYRQGVVIALYVATAAVLTLSTVRYQSRSYIRTVFLAIILLLPFAAGLNTLLV